MSYLIIGGQFVLSLSILIVLHEMGHFLPARWFKTRVEKFYLFFDPWFKIYEKKIGETAYGIGWLPLGGYVKISGMVDESMDTEQLKQPPQPWEFRSKPAWQRLIIMLGGVTVNFFLGLFLFAMIFWVWGEKYLPTENAKYGLYADSTGVKMGLQNGDRILSVGDEPFTKFNYGSFAIGVTINGAKTVTVQRGAEKITLPITEEIRDKIQDKDEQLFELATPFVIEKISKNSPAEKAGFQPKDSLIAINGDTSFLYNKLGRILRKNPSKQVKVTLVREGAIKDIDVTLDDEGKLGVQAYTAERFLNMETQHYGFFEAIPAGISKGLGFLGNQLKGFKKMFTGEVKATKSLGGFGTFLSLFPETWQWQSFWMITATLSLVLAFMNLLPIPALDGGHVVFLLWEMITGKKPSDKFLEYAQMVGFFILIGLLLFANGMDVYRAWFK